MKEQKPTTTRGRKPGKMLAVRGKECSLNELPAQMKDLSGMHFGRLVVLDKFRRMGKIHNSYTQWKCQCECGNVVWVRASNLKFGDTTSCGCLRKETSAINGKNHTGRKKSKSAARNSIAN